MMTIVGWIVGRGGIWIWEVPHPFPANAYLLPIICIVSSGAPSSAQSYGHGRQMVPLPHNAEKLGRTYVGPCCLLPPPRIKQYTFIR